MWAVKVQNGIKQELSACCIAKKFAAQRFRIFVIVGDNFKVNVKYSGDSGPIS